MNKMGLTLIYLWLVSLCSCQQELIEYEKGDVKVCIEQGEQWLHDFPLFLGINKKEPTSNCCLVGRYTRELSFNGLCNS